MKTEFLPPTEIEKQRAAWFQSRARPGLTMDEYWRLNEEALRLFPRTDEERAVKTRFLKEIPEFVL